MERTKKTLHTMGLITLIYAILVFAGGLMGFIMKNSFPSLLAGGLFGLTLVFTSIKIFCLQKWGLYLSFGLILLLDALFSYRYIVSHAFFPSGVMLLVSTLTLVLLTVKLRNLTALRT